MIQFAFFNIDSPRGVLFLTRNHFEVLRVSHKDEAQQQNNFYVSLYLKGREKYPSHIFYIYLSILRDSKKSIMLTQF